MLLKGFHYIYGDASDIIERKYLPDLQAKYPEHMWIRLDATIDEISVGKLTSEYYSNTLFSSGTVIVIRNADQKPAQVFDLVEQLIQSPVEANVLILVAGGWNKTTKLGKIIKKYFVVKELSKPEVKPFDMLDALTMKNKVKVLTWSEKLLEADMNPLALFSLVFSHMLLIRQIKQREGQTVDAVARELKQHRFRVQKAMVANRFWDKEDIDIALKKLSQVDARLRTWQYDPKMLLQMGLINICL